MSFRSVVVYQISHPCRVAKDVWKWEMVLAFGAFMFLLGLSAFRHCQKRRLHGPALLIVYGLICIAGACRAGAAQHLGDQSASFPRFFFGSLMVLFGGMSITALLIFRLLAYQRFGGNPYDLDFGEQWSKEKGWHPNMSCTNVISIGHASQGLLSVFLFPWTEYFFLRQSMPACALLGRSASLLVIGYPLYNVIKRLHKHRQYFAICSFYENTLEWSIGFVFGLAIGTLGTQATCLTPEELTRLARNLQLPKWELCWHALEMCRAIVGCLLLLITLVAVVQLWRTWDFVVEGRWKIADVEDVCEEEEPTESRDGGAEDATDVDDEQDSSPALD